MIQDIILADRPVLPISGTNVSYFWVYAVYTVEGGLEFVGCGKLSDIGEMRPIVRNELYRADRTYFYCLIEAVPGRIYAENAVNKWIKILSPNKMPAMNKSWMGYNTGRKIKCNETGEEFDTAAEACRKLGLTQSALSNHLANRKGFRSVHGLTFRSI